MSRLSLDIFHQLSGNETILLKGNLGAGKTYFAKKLISQICNISEDDICSPTFCLIQEYHCQRFSIYHSDLYRIKNKEDVIAIDIFEYINEALVIIEWPQIAENEIKQIANKVIEIDIKQE